MRGLLRCSRRPGRCVVLFQLSSVLSMLSPTSSVRPSPLVVINVTVGRIQRRRAQLARP